MEQNILDEFPSFTEVVCWPEIQNLMTKKGFRENSALINSSHGIDIYGSSAYRVDPQFIEDVKEGKCDDYTEEELLNSVDDELNVDYTFPFDEEEDDDED